MTSPLLKPSVSAAVGLLHTLPTCYFILISVLKYVLGFPALFDAAAPTLEAWGIKEAFGWNINLLIIFGPLLALLLNAAALIKVEARAGQDSLNLDIQILNNWLNWLVVGLSGLCLLILFVYTLGENCNC
jgi:hypothetical protein